MGLGGGFVFVPAGVFHVAVGNAVDLSLKELFGNGFYFFAGMPPQTSPDLMCVPCVTTEPATYDGVGLHHASIHDDSTHADEDVVVNRATVYDGVISCTDFLIHT